MNYNCPRTVQKKLWLSVLVLVSCGLEMCTFFSECQSFGEVIDYAAKKSHGKGAFCLCDKFLSGVYSIASILSISDIYRIVGHQACESVERVILYIKYEARDKNG